MQPSIYGTPLAEDRFLRNTRMYLAISADMNEGDLIAKTPYLVKVCSANHIEHLVRQALPGVSLTHVPKPPSAVPVKLNCQYFSVAMNGGAWEAITRARNLAALRPRRPAEAEPGTDYFCCRKRDNPAPATSSERR